MTKRKRQPKTPKARIRAELEQQRQQQQQRKREPRTVYTQPGKRERTQYAVVHIFPGGHPGSGKRR